MSTALKPIITWWEDYIDANDGQLKQRPVPNNLWDLGVVDADNNPDLTTHTFYIWNNKKPSSTSEYNNVPDMVNCRVTTKDGSFEDYMAGEMKSPLVIEQWVRINNVLSSDSSDSEIYIPIGSTFKNGVLTQKDIQITAMGSTDGTGVSTGTISGQMNDGKFKTESSKNNFAKIKAQVKVPPSADAEKNKFIVRVYYNV
ncbi:hypothetical protein [Clostridium rectalis]|uniref:hypothetical protein n=1 Tax=Clostridium rectalis TaxID=2040295 RepID=UPI000F639667|nr:hypothetical protein [Clostridium rectalis]